MPPILEVRDLYKYFPLKKGLFQAERFVRAVDGVSLSLNKGETLALVGESGSGKSTLGRCILKLIQATKGNIIFKGQDITGLSPKEMLPLRKEMQIVFQDPYSSLNPRMTVGELIGEALIEHGLYKRADDNYYAHVQAIMTRCGLDKEHLYRFPHQFSGGQRQRIGIARALALGPSLLIADEAVSALDVSVRAQILELLKELQQEMGLSYLFISHDLGVVKHIADRVAVMYLGKVVEEAPASELFSNPLHPYTKSLIAAAPLLGGGKKEHIPLRGEAPSNINPPVGCSFASRCPYVLPRCLKESPPLEGRGLGRCSCFLK